MLVYIIGVSGIRDTMVASNNILDVAKLPRSKMAAT